MNQREVGKKIINTARNRVVKIRREQHLGTQWTCDIQLVTNLQIAEGTWRANVGISQESWMCWISQLKMWLMFFQVRSPIFFVRKGSRNCHDWRTPLAAMVHSSVTSQTNEPGLEGTSMLMVPQSTGFNSQNGPRILPLKNRRPTGNGRQSKPTQAIPVFEKTRVSIVMGVPQASNGWFSSWKIPQKCMI